MAKFSKAHRLALSKAAKARYAVGKKRGVKPGTKRGRYRRNKRKTALQKLLTEPSVFEAKAYAPSPVLTLCGQLEDSILLLEQRISNAIAKINSLMG